MDFSILDDIHKNWRDIRVIGKTVERNGQKRHIIGMTLDDTARLYIIEPASKSVHTLGTKDRSQRARLKRPDDTYDSYLHCCECRIGRRILKVRGAQGAPLSLDTAAGAENYEAIKLFCDMLNAGWVIPEWLKDVAWDDLMLITLNIPDVKRLPSYTAKTPVTIVHSPAPMKHIIEKTVTLQVGKPRSFHFTDHNGDKVHCHINNVVLIDARKDMERRFNDPRYQSLVSEEQMRSIRQTSYEALKTSCPQGMYYIGIEYECSKDISLQFYTKQFLSSHPDTHKGNASFLMMHLKPDHRYGTHGLPLKGYVMQTAVTPDTVIIPAELLFYLDRPHKWEEVLP